MRGLQKIVERDGSAAAGALMASGLLMAACATNPVTGERSST